MVKTNLNINQKNMKAKFITAFLFTVLSVTLMVTLASAATSVIDFGTIEVDGIIANSDTVAVTGGETVSVQVEYTFTDDGNNDTISESEGPVVLTAWIQGAKSETRIEKTYNYDLVEGSNYVARFSIFIPADLDNDDVTRDVLDLVIEIETEDDREDISVKLQAQRESNKLDILLVEIDGSVKAGATVPVTVVVSNLGSREADDVFVTLSVPELGIVKTAFFADLFPLDDFEDDDGDKDREDTRERRIFLTIPSNAQAGVYQLEVTAESDDAKTTVIRPLVISETAVEGKVLANPTSKTFSLGESITYELVLVNTGREIAIYNIVPDASDALSISLSDTLVTVPAGSSKTVQVTVKATREGTFNFAVTAISENFSETAVYSATVEGTTSSFGDGSSNNVVVLTVVLAIIFVVLLVILIVLLTRKPEKSEEFGESYY